MRWHAAKTLVGLRVDLGKLEVRLFSAHGKSAPGAEPLTVQQEDEFQYLRMLVRKSDAELEALVRGVWLEREDRYSERRAALRGEATGAPTGFRGDVVSVAKRDLAGQFVA